MNWIVDNIRWIMLVSGVLTCTMVRAAIAPKTALRSTFGETLEGTVAEIVVRNWGVLIALVGAMLIYGAYTPAVRPLVLTVATVSKLAFIGLIVTRGRQFLRRQAGVAVAVDLASALLFIAWFIGVRAI